MYVNYNTDIFKNVNRISLIIACVGHAKVGNEWRGKLVSPLYSRLYHVIKGSFSITLQDGEKYTFNEGKWYLLPSGMSCGFECEDTMEHIYYHLKICDYDETDLLRNCTSPMSLDGNDGVEFVKENINTSTISTGLKIKNVAFSTLMSMVEKYGVTLQSRDYSACVMRALQYIRSNLSARLTVTEISENIFAAKSTLTKHFSKELSMSPNEYVTNLIMSKAETLLSTTNLPINSICEKLGFSDQLYFSRRFKQKFGVCPSEYRKNRRYLLG